MSGWGRHEAAERIKELEGIAEAALAVLNSLSGFHISKCVSHDLVDTAPELAKKLRAAGIVKEKL